MINNVNARPASRQGQLQIVRESESVTTWEAVITGTPDARVLDPTIMIVELAGVRRLSSFSSSWGLEFQPETHPIDTPVVLEVTSGRSTNQAMPWLLVETDAGCTIFAVHWSGNWRLVGTPGENGTTVIEIGLHPHGQRLALAPGEAFTLPAVSAANGADAREAAAALVRHLQAQVPPGPELLTEWNHWWPYEDAEINEDVFLANAEIAAGLGLEVAVLDAGWFGRPDAASHWFEERGDWHLVNSERFPHGLAWLAEQTRAAGIEFGIWIEAEAIGVKAQIAAERPELVALDEAGAALGYVCFGSEAGREHIWRTVSGLIDTTGARWIKWDFNLDPGAGCRRDDHGHGPDDGLLRHYLGLYAVLDRLRAAYPQTIFEACSSGGLRIDAGLAAHVDGFFLSDPDWTEHHLTCLWGAAQMLPPRQLLHWPQSEWRGDHRFQKVDYSGSLITMAAFDTKIRSALLHRFGVSVRLTQMRPDLLHRLRDHVTGYRDIIRPMLEDGALIPLTEQPLREEKGWRQPAFQLSPETADQPDRHLVAAFALPPAGDPVPVRPVGLDPAASYAVQVLDGDHLGDAIIRTGTDLVDLGLLPAHDSTSSIVWLLSQVA